MDDYDRKTLEKLWTVIRAAQLNPACHNEIEIKTTGYEPSASVRIPAYMLAKFVSQL